ncbi:MAG: iron chelate uptake ABC transporter family permease subunit [Actinobacteria bacterium]|nr:iron chelate uptake ABC transporter family permease subunit [Actinomycetota bacterium]
MKEVSGVTGKLDALRRRRSVVLLCLAAAMLVAAVVAVALGAVYVPLATSSRIIFSRLPLLGRLVDATWTPTQETIIISVRLPRVLLALLVGMGLALAGAIFQGLFRNPMADPSIIGSSQGAALGATIAFFFGIKVGLGGLSAVPLFAFAGSLLAVFAVYVIARAGGRASIASLLLVGIALSSFLASIVSLLMVVSEDRMHNIFFWLMGGLGTGNWDMVLAVLPFIAVGIVVSLFMARDLNLLMLGEERAAQLGLETERFKWTMIVVASLAVGAAVSVSGIIGFVGLMTPHIVRLLTGPDHRFLIPGSIMGGGLFLVLADTLARTVIAPNELPVGIVTAFFGAPFFIYLLKRSRQGLS